MIDKNNIPQHIAIIMDGNGRWAEENRLPRTAGHREGINRVKEIVKAAADLGVRALTLFAFSTENWTRPKKEISMLMQYLDNFLDKYVKELNKNNIKLLIFGRSEPLPGNIQRKIKEAQIKTAGNTGLILALALNYGSRQEIVDAASRLAESAVKGEISPNEIDTEMFARYLYTAELPDPDFLIRTSGELRLSNFLLWQLSYAELYFPKKYWPEFKKEDLVRAIKEYGKRQRRFGDIVSNPH